jgi:hypothetical protein
LYDANASGGTKGALPREMPGAVIPAALTPKPADAVDPIVDDKTIESKPTATDVDTKKVDEKLDVKVEEPTPEAKKIEDNKKLSALIQTKFQKTQEFLKAYHPEVLVEFKEFGDTGKEPSKINLPDAKIPDDGLDWNDPKTLDIIAAKSAKMTLEALEEQKQRERKRQYDADRASHQEKVKTALEHEKVAVDNAFVESISDEQGNLIIPESIINQAAVNITPFIHNTNELGGRVKNLHLITREINSLLHQQGIDGLRLNIAAEESEKIKAANSLVQPGGSSAPQPAAKTPMMTELDLKKVI